MKNTANKLIVTSGFALIAGLVCIESTYAQVRFPSTSVAALASQSDDAMAAQKSESVTSLTPASPKVTPVQYEALPTGQQQATLTQQLAPQPVTPQPVVPQLQASTPQPPTLPQTMAQPVMVPEGMNGVIVIPVVVPQYMAYPPPPAMMMPNLPAQSMYPQYPAQMMQPMYNPMAMQMMESQMMMQQQMMQQQVMPMMPQQAPVQQPIPLKILLPDGSTVSIKHYMPGKFFKNTLRAVTP